jgi:flagellar basal-body rod protein FlgC
MDLKNSMQIALTGMNAQSSRLRVIAENIANADSLALTPDNDPYRRKVMDFKSVLDRQTGARVVKISKVYNDDSEFGLRYEPSHPSANAEGYVKTPNVQTLIEMTDMREAQRSYEANLNVVDGAKQLLSRTIDLLR